MQVEELPETMLDGLQERLLITVDGVMVTEAVFEVPLAVAVTVTDVLVVTALVVTPADTVPVVAENVAVEEPPATVMLVGTVSAVLLSAIATLNPPVGAAAESVTVQVEVPPAVIDDGLQDRPLITDAGATVTEAVFEVPLAVAVTVTAVLLVTEEAVAEKVAVEDPAATVTDAGTARAALLSETVTARPVVGAAAVNAIVQVVVPPERTAVGLQERVLITGSEEIVIVLVFETPFADAVTVTEVALTTVEAVAAKVAEVDPAATVTDDGTDRAELLSRTVTTRPPAGAAELRDTLQVEVPPEVIEEGAQARLLITTRGVTVTEAVFEVPLAVAVTVTAVLLVTVAAVVEKEAVEAPAATVTEAGTVRAELLSERDMARPPVGAAPESETVHKEVPPEVTDVGEQVSRLGVTVGSGDETAIAPILTLRGIKLPLADAARPVNCRDGAEDAVLDTANVTVATTELPSAVAFNPESRHVEEPVALLQLNDLPALTALELAATLTAVKSVEGYASVHCNAAG